MLRSFFIILLYQLVGETIQKFFNIIIPGPVIGLVLLLITFIFIKKFKDKKVLQIKKDVIKTGNIIVSHLSLLFIPIGVGVVMHISYLGENLFQVFAVIVIGTLLTVAFTAKIMELLNKVTLKKK
jgi:holin-like protein